MTWRFVTLSWCAELAILFRGKGQTMLLALINVLIIIVIGAICFYLIDRFVRDGRLGNLLKILVVLFCLAAIVQRLLPILGINF